MLAEIPPLTELANLLAVYTAWGGVIEHILLGPIHESPTLAVHREAARRFMEIVQERMRQATQGHWIISYDMSAAMGEEIDASLFFNDAEGDAQRRWTTDQVGYAYAFFDPPYGLGRAGSVSAAISTEEVQPADPLALYEAMKRSLFGEDLDALQIISWTTGWSTYFDPGHEWWGAFLWTVYVPSHRWIVAVGASATD